MPANPENDMEARLRAYSEARRQTAGAPLEMHPATRRMLQAEVARALASAAPVEKPARGVWMKLWLRLAWAGGLAAAACVALVLTFSGDRGAEMRLADAQMPALTATPATAEFEAINLPPPPAPTADQAFALAFDADPVKKAETLERLGERKNQIAKANEGMIQREAPSGPAGKTSPPAQPALAGASPLDSQATPSVELEARRKSLEAGQALAKQELAEASKARFMAEVESKKLAVRTAELKDKSAASQADAFGGGGPADALGRGASAGLAVNQTVPPALSPAAPAAAASAPGAVPPAAKPLAVWLEAARESQSGLAAYASQTAGARFVQRVPAQNYRQNFNSPPAPAVLNSFQFEQLAGAVRIVDADGSVYVGTVTTGGEADDYSARPKQDQSGARSEPESRTAGSSRQFQAAPAIIAEERSRKPAAEDEARARAGQAAASQQQVFFRVSGTNRSLNQTVVFTGNALVQGAPPAAQALNQTATGREPAQEKAAQAVPLAPILRIEGRASIGGRSQVPVEAVPQRP